MPPIRLIVSIDTEEDNWKPRRDGVTIDNIRELPTLDAHLRRCGVRATYLTTYQVAREPWAAALLRDLRAGGAEIGAHLHPWNTPPLDEPFTPRNTMLKNLSPALQLSKLQRLTATLEAALGARPTSFRAGRYGFGPATAAALIRCGYRVDSSVTPLVSWEAFDGGPSFTSAPLDVYPLGARHDVQLPDPEGPLVEVPMSTGFSRTPFHVWSGVFHTLTAWPLRSMRLWGIATRLGVIKRILLSPETHAIADLLTLSRRLIEQGARHLHLFFHSPSLRPGLSPFVSDAAGVEAFYQTIATYVERLAGEASLECVTLSEAAAQLQASTPRDPVTAP